MSNTLLTPTIIAKQALMILTNNLIAANLVYKDYAEEFVKVGDTVNIRKPASFTARDFTTDNNEIVVQNATEVAVPVQMNKHKDVSFAVTTKELSLQVQDFSAQFLKPAIVALAQQVDVDILSLYKYVPYFYGTAGVTPTSLLDISKTRAILSKNKAPIDDRMLVIDPDAQAQLGVLDIFHQADSQTIDMPDGLVRSAVGRTQGFATYMDQNVVSHVAGGDTAAAIDYGGGYAAGVSAIHLDGLSAAVKVGDLMTIGGFQHTAIAVEAIAGADQDITIYPALQAAVSNDDPVTLIASHAANLAFHRNAFALVTRPLAAPMGPATVSYQEYNGLTIRCAIGYDITKKQDICSLDLLYGVKTIYPELAARLLG